MDFFDILIVVLVLDSTRLMGFFCSKYNLLSFLAKPISEKFLGEKRIWREAILNIFFITLFGYFLFGFYIALGMGLAWEIAGIWNSFIKRRIGIPPGGHARGIFSLVQYVSDTMIHILPIVLFLSLSFHLPFSYSTILVIVLFFNACIIDMILYGFRFKQLDFPNPLVIFFQILVTIAFRPIHYSHGMWKMHHIKSNKEGNIFICNHISKLDAFLISTGIDWSSSFRFLPFRFMITNYYMKKKIIGFLLILVGGYQSHHYDKNGKNQSLQNSRVFLDRGETVVIFPEGSIRDNEVKVGAFYLNKNHPGSLLHLFHIKKFHSKFFISYLGTDSVTRYNQDEDLLDIGKKVFHKIEEKNEV